MSKLPENMRLLLEAAARHLRGGPSLGERSAIRRAARTSEWKHDEERLAAAEAKRARKRRKAIFRQSIRVVSADRIIGTHAPTLIFIDEADDVDWSKPAADESAIHAREGGSALPSPPVDGTRTGASAPDEASG